MTEVLNPDFQKRLERIAQKHADPSRGYVPMKEVDGLTVPVPPRRRRRRRGFPLRGLALSIVSFILFKAVLLAYLGPVAYDSRLALLADGSLAERIGAKAFAVDPLSLYLARWMGLLPGLLPDIFWR